MKLRWRRWLALAILVFGAASAVGALYSTTVLRMVVDRIAAGIDGLEYDSIEGRLATGIRVTGLRWRNDETRLQIDVVSADWDLLPALSRHLRIRSLAIGAVEVAHAPSQERERRGDPVDLNLPWEITVHRLTVSSLDIVVAEAGPVQLRGIEGSRLRLRNGVARLGSSSMRWSLPDGPSGTLTARGRTGGDIDVALALDDGTAQFAGALATALASPTVAGRLQLRELDPSTLHTAAPAMTLTGELELDGWIESLALRGQLMVTPADQPAATVDVQARWGVDLLVVREFALQSDALPVTLSGNGRIDWSSPLYTATVHAGWRANDPSWPSPAGQLRAHLDGGSVTVTAHGGLLGGEATLDGVIAWPIEPDGIRGRADISWTGVSVGALTSPSGSVALRGGIEAWHAAFVDTVVAFDVNEIEVSGEVEGGATSISVIDLAARSGPAHARLTGTIAERWNLRWSAEVPDLSELRSSWSGPLHGEGSLIGLPEELALTLEATTVHGAIALEARGQWHERAFAGSLEPVTLTMPGQAPWRADEPVAFRAARDSAHLSRACWRQEAMSYGLCFDAAWSATNGVRVQAELARMTLADLSPWLPQGLVYEGAMGGDATILVPVDGEPEVTAALTLAGGGIRQVHRGDSVTLVRWRKAIFNGRFVDGDIAGDLRLILAEGGNLQIATTVPVQDTAVGPATARPLRVELRGELSALDIVPALVPEVGSLRGVIRADVLVEGSRAQPSFNGAIEVVDGIMTLPTLGLRLTDLTAAVSGDRESLSLEVHARSGEGTFDAAGAFRIESGRLRGNATLRGDSFQAINLPEAEIHLAPNLTLFIDGHTILLGGSVHVPYARIAPGDRIGLVRRSGDEIVVDAEDTGDLEDPWRLFARVRVTVENAQFDGYGLSGIVSGALTVTETPNLPTRATGTLQIDDGRYTAWGQQLEIERGRLIYNGGPISTPGLDVRAVRRPRNVMVGVNVRGTLTTPQLRLISEPPMQQAELLSWLVLGVPLQQASGNDRQLLDDATRGAGLAGGEFLAREVGRRLGLSDVGIEHGAQPEQAALVVGHYLSPRLYVAWGMGIFDNEQSLRLRYHLNRMWTVEAQTGERATSADIKYSVER